MSHAHNSAPAHDDIDLGGVMATLMRRLPRLVVLSLGAGALAAGVLSTMGPRYMSQAQLEIRGGIASDALGRPDKEAVGTHVRSIMATDLALKAAKELKLADRPDFNSALEPDDLFSQTLRKVGIGLPKSSETTEDRLLQAYYKQVRAYQVRETRSVIIDCTSSEAKFSSECANKVAELYRSSLRGRTVVENGDVQSKLAPEVERLTREIAQIEAEATEFRGKANLFQGGAQSTQLKEQQLGELTAELTRTATQRSDLDARADAAREMLRRGVASANPDVQRSTLLPRLEETRVRLEGQISELSATLLPAHPRMRQLTSELSGLQRQIRDELQRVVDSLGNDARIAGNREDSVRRRIEEMKKTVVASAGDTARLSQIEAAGRAKRLELERVQKQYEAASSIARAGAVQTEVEIVSRAYASNEKVFPKIGTMSALTAVSAFILGLAFMAMREIALGGRRGQGSAAAAAVPASLRVSPDLPAVPAAIPVAAASIAAATASAPTTQHVAPPIPPVLPANTRTAPVESDNLSTPVIETAAVLISKARPGYAFRTLITGCNPLIDATAEAVELSRALAASGRSTLMLAWGTDIAGVSTSGHGLSDLLTGSVTLENAIHPLPNSSAQLIGQGGPAETMIDSEAASSVLDALDELYEHVVVVGPHATAQQLFSAIEGRFDAGVLVADKKSQMSDRDFLGFEVPEFLVVPLVRGQSSTARHGKVPTSSLETRPFGTRT